MKSALRRGWLSTLMLGAGAATRVAGGDGLALTPLMGWNSWNKFGCDMSETLVKGRADAA
jgi:alpha-galactosidase